jgi:hypothetical protein
MLTQTDLEDIDFFYGQKLVNPKAAPFTEQEVKEEQDPAVQGSMCVVIGLLGLKAIGEHTKYLANYENAMILGHALAILRNSNRIDTSQGIALVKQLFQ